MGTIRFHNYATKVPVVEMNRASGEKKTFETDPKAHTYIRHRRESIMATKRKFKSAEAQELYAELIEEDPEAQEEIEEELVRIEAAVLIYEMRKKAGLSQQELCQQDRNVGIRHQPARMRRV
jgi:hypothetical protein